MLFYSYIFCSLFFFLFCSFLPKQTFQIDISIQEKDAVLSVAQLNVYIILPEFLWKWQDHLGIWLVQSVVSVFSFLDQSIIS